MGCVRAESYIIYTVERILRILRQTRVHCFNAFLNKNPSPCTAYCTVQVLDQRILRVSQPPRGMRFHTVLAGHVTLHRKQTNPDSTEPAPRSCLDSTRVTTPYPIPVRLSPSESAHLRTSLVLPDVALRVHAPSSLCLRSLSVPPLPPSTSITSSAYLLHQHSSTKPRTITRRIYTPLLHPIAPPH